MASGDLRPEHRQAQERVRGDARVYPALYRLERQGFIASDWGTTENNRRARYYTLTAAGRRHLAREVQSWQRMARAITLVLKATEA